MQKLFEAGELASADTRNPRLLQQTTWFYISLYFGKRGKENQSAMKKSMLRLAVTPSGEEYYELNKDEPARFGCSVFVTENCLFVNSTTVECELPKLSKIERVTTCQVIDHVSSRARPPQSGCKMFDRK